MYCFVYKNFEGIVRRLNVRMVADPAAVANILAELLDTPVTWRSA